MIYLSHFQSFTFLFSSKINGNENKPTPSTFFFCKDPVSMRLVCFGCELENKPELCCCFLRAKMKRLYTTKNEKAHNSTFSRLCSRLVAYNWSYETSVATLFPETISFGQLPQYMDLLASSPSAFLNQHHSNFPAQQGFPAPGAVSASITARNLTAKTPQLPEAEARRQWDLQGANANVCLWKFSVKFMTAFSTWSFWKLTFLLSYGMRCWTAGFWFRNIVTKWLSVRVWSILWLTRQSHIGTSAVTYSLLLLLTQFQYSNPHIPVRG